VNPNISLVGQIITFAILAWVMMKYVWPPIVRALEERHKNIADGLAAAERGRQELKEASARREELLSDARAKAGEIIHDGERRRNDAILAAKSEAEAEKERIISAGRQQAELERAQMAREMQDKVAVLVVKGAEQILRREIDAKAHAGLLDELKKEL
jgi:F-type H+-transporting ATPase subunit b